MNILFMGASGSGKGTQAKLLNEKYNLCHVSMGDLFREAREKGTPNGLKAYEYVKNGILVPLEITVQVLNDKIIVCNEKSGKAVVYGVENGLLSNKLCEIDICKVLCVVK